MKIQSKLSWTYNLLLLIGVLVISSYAILSIRSFLLDEGITQLQKDAKLMALAIANFEEDNEFLVKVAAEAYVSGYDLALFDEVGSQLVAFPDTVLISAREFLNSQTMAELIEIDNEVVIINEKDYDKLIAFIKLPNTINEAHFLRISQFKGEFYAAIQSIRHIIYTGMIFSVGGVIFVSFYFARYMSRPILDLNEAALDIASGNLDREIIVDRKDEFSTLAQSLNKMASTLKADNEKLKMANEKQSQFFADITHEVRNPLHTIAGALEMLELKNLEEEKKEQYIQTAQKQIHRVTRLFEDIKSLQRYDFDENFIHRKPVDIYRVMKDVVAANKQRAGEKDLELVFTKKGKTQVNVDPDKIEQVLDNLVTNAIKFTTKGSITIACEEEGKKVKISVSDTGTGIAEEHLNRLFDRFYRTDKARSRDKGGTGLGLAVVKGILHAHGEEIYVSSKIGKGSQFYFSLPMA